MIRSGRRASVARAFNVSNAVSETPVRVTFSAWLTRATLPAAAQRSILLNVRRLRVVVEAAYRLLPMVFPTALSGVLPLGTCQ